MTEEKAPANRIEPRTHYQDPKDATIWGKLYRVHGRTRHAVAIRVFRPILAGTLTSGRRPLATTSPVVLFHWLDGAHQCQSQSNGPNRACR